MLAPIAQTAPGVTWPAALVLGGVCLGASWCIARYGSPPGPFVTVVQGLWSCVVAAMVLRWVDFYWPSSPTAHWVAPVLLLLLSAWAALREGRAQRAGCTLIWATGLLLGAVLLSGLPEISWEELKPSWKMSGAEIVPILLLPALLRGRGNPAVPLLGFTAAACIVTAGVLSYPVAAAAQAPIYELSRNLSLFGTAQRFESLAAMAMTLGFFTVLSFLLTASNIENKRKASVFLRTLVTAAIFLLDAVPDSRVTAIGSLVTYLALPALESLKNFCRKKGKGA